MYAVENIWDVYKVDKLHVILGMGDIRMFIFRSVAVMFIKWRN